MESKLSVSSGVSCLLVVPRKRERRAVSRREVPTSLGSPMEPTPFDEQTNSVDATFEPTIEMMVNDFDDEQTLNEEEAMAALEFRDPQEEIATLQKESEIPIEELLAKYREVLPVQKGAHSQKRRSKNGSKKRTTTILKSEDGVVGSEERINGQENLSVETESAKDVIVIDSGEEENEFRPPADRSHFDISEDHSDSAIEDQESLPQTQKQKHRSHLIDLYPENYSSSEEPAEVTLETLYGADDDEECEEDEESDLGYVRKTIMVGSAYQAVIPTSLSKYGDVLPYENEDKLIWEPSQVSEEEVKEYLVKAGEIKSYIAEKELLTEDDVVVNEDDESASTYSPGFLKRKVDATPEFNNLNGDSQIITEAVRMHTDITTGNDSQRVVRDNEQALHLLVQCGYDFKEALRRKRLNAVPLNGSMSIWSEEECLKFEEGIQKFGKDFLKIRQHQVRTRSMRELVQFYYLWKKSERRDHEFADSDTVDHMDMYLDEGDYNSNATSTTNLHATSLLATSLSEATNSRKGCSSVFKNYSIMTGKQNPFSVKSSHIRRHSSHNDNNEHLGNEKSDSQNILLNVRK